MYTPKNLRLSHEKETAEAKTDHDKSFGYQQLFLHLVMLSLLLPKRRANQYLFFNEHRAMANTNHDSISGQQRRSLCKSKSKSK